MKWLAVITLATLALLVAMWPSGTKSDHERVTSRSGDRSVAESESSEVVAPAVRSTAGREAADPSEAEPAPEAESAIEEQPEDDAGPEVDVGALEVTIPNVVPVGNVRLVERVGVSSHIGRAFPFVDGVARIEEMGLGHRYELEAEFEGTRYTAQGYGPTRPGETVHVELRPVADTRLRFRPVDQNGEAIGRRIKAIARSDDYRCSSGESGTYEVALPPKAMSTSGPTSVQLVESSGSSRNEAAFATVELAPSMAGREVDLGDVVLELPPILCQGTVVDANGDPCRRAHVQLLRRSDDWVVRGSNLHLGDRTYGSLHTAATRCDRNGEFTMRSVEEPTAGGAYRLFVVASTKRGLATAAPVPFTRGQTGVVVRLVESGSLSFDVTTFRPVQLDIVEVVLDREDMAERRLTYLGTENEFTNLTPGSWSLRISYGQVTVIEHEGLVVPSGGRCSDPRLAGIDQELATKLLARTFRVECDDGGLAKGLELWSTNENGRWEHLSDLDSYVEPRIMTCTGSRAALMADTYGAVEVTDLADGATVRMARTQNVHLQLPGSAIDPDGTFAQIQRTDADLPLSPVGSWTNFNGLGRADVELPVPSQHRIELRVKDGGSWRDVRASFDVLPGQTEIPITLQ